MTALRLPVGVIMLFLVAATALAEPNALLQRGADLLQQGKNEAAG